MSRKIAKILFKQMNQNFSDKVIDSLKQVRIFLMINDSLKQHRMEWLLGIPQIVHRDPYRGTKHSFGAELVDMINETAYDYRTTLFRQMSDDCVFSLIMKQRGRQDQIVIYAIKELMKMSLKCDVIARYVHTMLPHTYQLARFTDFFEDYIQT